MTSHHIWEDLKDNLCDLNITQVEHKLKGKDLSHCIKSKFTSLVTNSCEGCESLLWHTCDFIIEKIDLGTATGKQLEVGERIEEEEQSPTSDYCSL